MHQTSETESLSLKTSVAVRQAEDADEAAWDKFVAAAPYAHLAHRFGWSRVINKAFGHRPLYLLAEDTDGELTGILPLFHVRGFLFGEALISVPYLNGGGLLARDPHTASSLISSALNFGGRFNPAYTEFRHREECPAAAVNAEARTHKAAMLLELRADAEELFGSFPAKLRSQIRRPTKDGLVVSLSEPGSEKEALSAFYQVFAENMRDLGTPVYPKRFFVEAVREFARDTRIAIVYKGSQAVASGITIGTNETCEIPWASALKRYNKLSPNMLLYWGLIKRACEDGWRRFDFGRSSLDSGTYRFKQQWGAKPLILHWYYPHSSRKIPEINPKSRKFSTLVACWQKLPLKVANLLGPWLTASLP